MLGTLIYSPSEQHEDFRWTELLKALTRKMRWFTAAIALIIVSSLAIVSLQTVFADQNLTRTQQVHLYTGDSLLIQSDKASIQQVFVAGNVSAAKLTKPPQFPVNDFELQASSPGSYDLTAMFNNPTSYQVNVFVRDENGSLSGNSTTYYMSGGSFELDMKIVFGLRPDTPATVSVPSVSPWESFVGWVGRFGQAFPLWVRVLYLVLGLQFFAVGGLWIRREANRSENSPQRLDLGDKVYLWLDVAYKFLVASFVAIVVIMGGELLLLFVLRFMFLITLDLLSLWDLFVVGFAAGAIILVYLLRFVLERAFDMKPVGDE